MQIRERLGPRSNPLFEHAEVIVSIARRDGELVGRISAQIDGEHQNRYGDGAGKPQIALEMIGRAVQSGVPRGIVLADAGYGTASEFRAGVRALGLEYGAAIADLTPLVDAPAAHCAIAASRAGVALADSQRGGPVMRGTIIGSGEHGSSRGSEGDPRHAEPAVKPSDSVPNPQQDTVPSARRAQA